MGDNLILSDSAPSFHGVTDGPTFPSIVVHDPPSSRLAANGYVSSGLNPRGRQKAACVILRAARGKEIPIIYECIIISSHKLTCGSFQNDGTFQRTQQLPAVNPMRLRNFELLWHLLLVPIDLIARRPE